MRLLLPLVFLVLMVDAGPARAQAPGAAPKPAPTSAPTPTPTSAPTQTPTSAPTQTPTPTPPRLSFAFELRVKVGAPLVVGQVPGGTRRIVQILGGTIEGPSIKGRVLPGGADWQMIQADGFSALDTRYTIETDRGQTVYVQNGGIRHAAPEVMQKLLAGQTVDPSLVYFRTVPTFETAAPELQWLTRAVFVGVGERYPDDVVIRFWRVE